jgi:fructoselysine-6-P-deglycase FrlB-like protein
MNACEAVNKALKEKSSIDQVYWVGCGGSAISLYPAHYLLLTESKRVDSHIFTAREFTVATPKKLGEHSLVVALSHSGNTPEVIDACKLASSRGAFVFSMSSAAGSAIDKPEWNTYIYEWSNETRQKDLDPAQSLMVAAELLKLQEDYIAYDALCEGIEKLDGIISRAKKKVNEELCERFANLCKTHDFFYIVGSGANFGQTYGLAICSLMEMQWQNCCYIHSGEYFHGPFECTEPGVFYFLQMSSGPSRIEDERVLNFLKGHTDTIMVLDALEYGMAEIDESVRAYLEPIMMYYMNVQLRAARGRLFDHDPSIRRYMGIEKY